MISSDVFYNRIVLIVISCSSTESGCERGPSHSAGIPDDPLKVCLRFTAIGKLATIFGKMNHSIRLKSTPKGTDPKGLHLGFLKYFKKASSNLILPHPCMLFLSKMQTCFSLGVD